MLEAASAATLETEKHDPKEFLLLLGNTVSSRFNIYVNLAVKV